MQIFLAIVATLALVTVSVSASTQYYDADMIKDKLNKANDADYLKLGQMSTDYWNLAMTESDAAEAARLHLAVACLNSISNIRHAPLAEGIGSIVKGVAFERDIGRLLQFNTDLNQKLESKLRDLYQLGKDSKVGKMFFKDVAKLNEMLVNFNNGIGRILVEGIQAYEKL